MSTEEKSIVEICKEYFVKEIDAGFKVTDHETYVTIQKKARASLKIKRGSSDKVKRALDEVLKEKQITIPKLEKRGGGIDAKFEQKQPLLPSPSHDAEGKMSVKLPTDAVSSGAPIKSLENKDSTSESTTKTPFIPSPEERLKQQETAESAIGGIIEIIFERLSILEPKKKPQNPEEKLEQSEQMRNDISEFSKELGGVLYDNGIKLPSIIKYVDLGIKGYKAIASPLLSKLGGGSDQETAKEITEEEKNREEAMKNV